MYACDLTPGSSSVVVNVVQRTPDIRDAGACLRLMRAVRPTLVVHAAAVTRSEDPALLQAVNVLGTANLLDSLMAAGTVERCLLISSSAVYGAALDARPCDEEHPLDLRGEYARSKWQAEQMFAVREDMSGIPMLAARVGPCYGPGERSGTFRPRMSLIGTLATALKEQRSIRVAGSDCSRDWTHVDDVARAISLLLNAPVLRHRIYNVSSGVAVSARRVLELFVNHDLQVQCASGGSGDSLPADVTLAPRDSRKPMILERLRTDTGFVPSVSIEAGIVDVVKAQQPERTMRGPAES